MNFNVDLTTEYGLDIYSPVNEKGAFIEEVEFFKGMNVFDANPKVIEKLRELGLLLHTEEIEHSYPHCWRCKKPVIFRATEQWFVSMDSQGLRQKGLAEVDIGRFFGARCGRREKAAKNQHGERVQRGGAAGSTGRV